MVIQATLALQLIYHNYLSYLNFLHYIRFMSAKYYFALILFLCLHTTISKAQWESLSLEVSPALTKYFEKPDRFDIPFTFAYGSAIHTGWKCSRHFSLEVGIHYKMKCIEITNYPDFDEDGHFDSNSIEYVNRKSNHNYYGINLAGRIIFSKAEQPKAPFYLKVGLECSDLSYIKTTTEYTIGTEVHTHRQNTKEISLNASALISTGMLFRISERTAFYAETGYAYDFYAYNYHYDYKDTRFQSVFLTVGFAYILKSKKSSK